ncbi:unnamed protein product [Pylaiella littoralis]
MKRKRQKTGQKHRSLACSFVSSVRLFVCVHDTHIPRSSVYVTLSSFSRLLKRLLGSINIYIQISQREYSQLQKTAAELLLRSLYSIRSVKFAPTDSQRDPAHTGSAASRGGQDRGEGGKDKHSGRSMSNLVDSWLNGIGLGYAVPVFAGQGISSPEMLAELDIVDFPELGISDQNDRKKLFYLIQRVKLALARGQAAGTKGKKAAPQADSAVSSTSADAAAAAAAAAAAIEGGHRHREPAAGAKESQAVEHASSSSTALNSARFRRELEIPASPSRSALSSPRAATAGRNASAAAGGGGFRGAGGRPAAAKAQRLPPSHTRPKTPHADGTVRGSSHQQQREQSSVGARTSAPGASRARQKQQKQQQQQQQRNGRGSAVTAAVAARRLPRPPRRGPPARKKRRKNDGACWNRCS